jgi:fatty-acyl-CoA synthase
MTSTAPEQPSSGYGYGLLIKNLLETGLTAAPEQTIAYADKQRFTYRELSQRIGRLASGLASLGVRPGNTVAVMDWDTHRYLECFFAVPMMGAVLRHINPRLSPEQILYTINHARDDVILINGDFLTLVQQIWGRVEPGKKIVLLSDGAPAAACDLPIAAEYESLLVQSDPNYGFPDLDENTRATTFYTTVPLDCPRACITLIDSSCCTPWRCAQRLPTRRTAASPRTMSTCRSPPCFTCTRGACPMWRPCSA